jgi:hypothetical protein
MKDKLETKEREGSRGLTNKYKISYVKGERILHGLWITYERPIGGESSTGLCCVLSLLAAARQDF